MGAQLQDQCTACIICTGMDMLKPRNAPLLQRDLDESQGMRAGVSALPDGSVIVTGGDDAPKTSVYDPATDAWLPYQTMNIPRGYQSWQSHPGRC